MFLFLSNVNYRSDRKVTQRSSIAVIRKLPATTERPFLKPTTSTATAQILCLSAYTQNRLKKNARSLKSDEFRASVCTPLYLETSLTLKHFK